MNCVRPDTAADDTLPALRESLALRYRGSPVLDGVELDVLWFAAESRCLLAHDFSGDTTTTASDAGIVLADYLRTTKPASWNGERFFVFVELKPSFGPGSRASEAATNRANQADCALDLAAQLIAGARDSGQDLTIGFTSTSNAHLETLAARPRYPMLAAADVDVLLVGDIFIPLSDVVPELSDYTVPLDVMEYHPDYMTEGKYHAYRSLGLELMQWSFAMSVESFDGIQRYKPRWVITNEAELLRRWIER